MADTAVAKPSHRIWTRDEYSISTDPSLIDATLVNQWFASKDMHWTNSLPDEAMREVLQNSLCFGMYRHRASKSPDLVGFARCVTDRVTFVYMTDVYIVPELRGSGLGSWLIRCVREHVDSMPHLRQSMLLTSDRVRSVPFYEKLMGMTVYESPQRSVEEQPSGLSVLMRREQGHPLYHSKDTS